MQKIVSESVATFILKKTKPMPAQVLKVAAIDTLTTLSSAGRIATLAVDKNETRNLWMLQTWSIS